MANTVNTPIENTWTLIAGAGIVAASALHPSDRAEWIVTDSGAPSEAMIGHPVPRNAPISVTLQGTEELYMRNRTGNYLVAAVTMGLAE